MSDEPRPVTADALRLLRTLWAIDHALHARSKRTSRTLGVTGPQQVALRLVGRTPGISPGQLAQLLCLHPSTLTGILRRLERRGLLLRVPDASDARRSILALTARGTELDAQPGAIESAIQSVLEEFPGPSVDRAIEILGAIATRVTAPEPR